MTTKTICALIVSTGCVSREREKKKKRINEQVLVHGLEMLSNGAAITSEKRDGTEGGTLTN
jgi:hypothetical protein